MIEINTVNNSVCFADQGGSFDVVFGFAVSQETLVLEELFLENWGI